ncbi:hypothetical protein A6R68_09584 [Neotoma lepida]|uniref:G-protein coupled receptors family 1 profile domain-containing protein n=1 Tax=Neotoma lepida TaxID=56216 RepID=A0A1A6FZF8_NEOLE|nr:hypothetical protein A6R68_09584 [Neotoma lepida]
MIMSNQTVISQFLLLGLSIPPEHQLLLYALFLAMYLTTVLGNLIIIILILLDSHLHTPMYLFLSNLSFSDLCFSSVTMPKLLQNTQSQDPSIHYVGCMTQMYFLMVFGDMESFLLVVMAYDRYVAICYPLHYTNIMNPKLCVCLIALSWVLTVLYSMLHTLLLARLSFCEDNVIPQFFCDISALLKLACSDIYINELMIFILGGVIIVIPFLLIIVSYVRIVGSILKVSSARVIYKTFSTCGSHLTVVSLFYGTIIGLYIFPSANNSSVKETAMAMMYTVVTPMLNPFIYSLRNRDMKEALIRFLLLGLPILPEHQLLFYALFLAMYLTTVLGNLIIIILILLDSHLHTPMYLFLSNLSFSDLCFSSVTMPKLLQNMQSQDPSIHYVGCMTQMYFLMVFGDMESFLLVVMAYDRYVAICYPLHYTNIMNPELCVCLIALSWVLTVLYSLLHTLLLARLSFCEDNVIPQFFCDISALLKLACSDIYINELMIFILGGVIIVIPFLLIIVSYVRIVSSILKVSSARVIYKTFSTCGSHLTVVSLFYGTIIGLYIFPSANNSTVKETAMAMMYTVVTPMLNPFIYSLRNRDMKEALIRVLCKKKISL